MTAIERALTNGKPAGSVGTAVGVAEAASTSLVAGAASAELPHWPAQGRGAWPAYSEPATQPAASAKATSASAMPTVPTPPRVARVAWCIAASIAVGIGHGKPLDQDRDQISRRMEPGVMSRDWLLHAFGPVLADRQRSHRWRAAQVFTSKSEKRLGDTPKPPAGAAPPAPPLR